MAEYQRTVLANGLRLLVSESPHLHSVEIVCYVGVGSRNEGVGEAGISHFLEHMLFRGNDEYSDGPAIEQAFEHLGGSINAATDAETTLFAVNVHPDCADEALRLLALLLLRPTFAGLETERAIILEEALADFNDQGEDICPDNRMAALLWCDHPLARPVIGYPHTIRAVDEAALRRWHRRYYVPGNVVISVAGAVDNDAMCRAAQRYFAAWNGELPPPPPLWQPRPLAQRTCWVRDSAAQVTLQLGWRSGGRNAPDAFALRGVRCILGDGGACRLMRSLREEAGLTYSVDATLEEYAECGCFSIDLAVEAEKLPLAVKLLLREVAAVMQEIEAEELQRLVRSSVYRLHFSRDDVSALAARYGWGELSGDMQTLDDERRAWNNISAAAICRAARHHLRLDNLCLVCIGPWREQERAAVEALLQ